jgi:hypothetical protein
MAQVAGHLPNKHKVLNLIPNAWGERGEKGREEEKERREEREGRRKERREGVIEGGRKMI